MTFFAPSSRKASKFAIAAAIMGIGAFGVTSFDAPASAQRDKKESAPQYSDEFREAIAPIQESLDSEGADKSAILDQIVAAEATVSTDDDKFVYGNALYRTALEVENYELTSKGMEMMLESGRVPESAMASYTANAGRLAFNIEDYPLARKRLQQSKDLGSQDADIDSLIVQTFTLEDNPAAGLEYIMQQIDEQRSAGDMPSAELLERGLMTAYNAGLYTEASNLGLAAAKYYPGEKNWRNAIGVHRDLGQLTDGQMLDLMRLLRATGYMKDSRDYGDYIDVANFRLLPGEVLVVAREGVAAGLLNTSEVFVSEAISESESQVPGLRADLPGLERDASAASSTAKIVLAAADSFFNFGEYAKAAELYELGLTRPAIDQGAALTRLGIAQHRLGNHSAALETLAKVDGSREGIAQLWAAYIEQQMSGEASPVAN